MNLEEIIKSSELAEKILEEIRHKEKCVVMFVDLSESTEFKGKNPDEFIWLKRLAIFLNSITNIVNINGRVVKYIGDEVMAIFNGDSPWINAFHTCENILEFCKKSSYEYKVKIGLEYGDVSFISFGKSSTSKMPMIPADPQGIIVDKCARLMQKAKPNTVVCSDGYYKVYPDKNRWQSCGRFQAKGIKKKIPVYQLKTLLHSSEKIIIEQEQMSIEDCTKRVKELEEMIKELKAIHK